jgi:hypothetical protein
MSYIGNQPTSVAFLTDQFSGTGSQTAYTLSAAPANTASILVAVSGVLQDPSTYSVAGTTLTFSAAPPSGTANISIRYLGIPASNITTTAYSTRTDFTATAGQTTFTVPSYTVNFIQVYRNGVLLGNADFTATSGTTVVLTTGATAGDLVTTISFFVSSVLGAIPATNGAVTTAYLLDGSVTQSKLATNVAGNGPAFSAYINTAQVISNATNTKVQNGVKNFDTNNCFDSTTNYRFTPTVAGYYQVNANLTLSAASTSTVISSFILKNGTTAVVATQTPFNSGASYVTAACSTVLYMNGTTDYIEQYVWQNSGGSLTVLTGRSDLNSFSASLVRAA